MGSLRLAMLVMVLAGSGTISAADGPSPNDSTPAPAPATDRAGEAQPQPQAPASDSPRDRPEPPAPPRKYLEAGANLFNRARFDLARKYLLAAHMYRDRLTASERVVLDVYREKLDHLAQAQAAGASAAATSTSTATPPAAPEPKVTAAPTGDNSVAPVSLSTSSPSRSITPPLDPIKALSRRPDEDAMPNMMVPPGFDTPAPIRPGEVDPSLPQPMADRIETEAGIPTGTATFRGTIDTKQKARWLLQLAREQIVKQHFDLAEQAIAEARSLDVKWTMFDETPERLMEALSKARVKAGARPGAMAATSFPSLPNGEGPRDRRAAKARLKEARIALSANHLDRADEIVREVRGWGVSFGLFDDTPDKVAAAIYDARRKDALRNAEMMIQSYYREQERNPTGAGAMTGPPVRPTLPD